jgi:plastocyanin
MGKIITIVLVIIVVIGGIFLFRNKSSDTTPTNVTTDNSGVVSSGAVDTTSDVTATSTKTFTVTGSNFAFAPSALTVKKGDKVTIHFVNSGGNHDFVIDEFNAKTPVIGSGQTADVSFIADKTGTFDYYCSVDNHRQMGMQGVITVK